ncbi:MAG: hypothetical protein ACRC33_18540 [Gemmataceae bacterium]
MNRSTRLRGIALALTLTLTFATDARADLIPWMYNWSRWPAEVNADAPGTGYITLTDESLRTVVGDSDIVASNLRAVSTAPPTAPDVFTDKGYNLALYLRDLESGEGGTLTFTGVLNGKITAQSANVKNTFTGLTTQSIVLGGNRYTATMTSYTPPGVPGASNPGAIGSHATVTVISLAELPEPGTMALSAAGAGLLALSRLRRRFASRAAGAETS